MRTWLIVKLLKLARKLIVEKYGGYVKIKIYSHWMNEEQAEQFATKLGNELGVKPIPYVTEVAKWLDVSSKDVELSAFYRSDNNAE